MPLWLVESEIRSVLTEQGVPKEQIQVLWAGDIKCKPASGGEIPFYKDSLPMVLVRGGGRLWRGCMSIYENDIHVAGVSSCPEPEGTALIYLEEPWNGWIIPENPLIGAWTAVVNLDEEIISAEVVLELPQGGKCYSTVERRSGDAIIFSTIPKEVLERECLVRNGEMVTLSYTLKLLNHEGMCLEAIRGTLHNQWR